MSTFYVTRGGIVLAALAALGLASTATVIPPTTAEAAGGATCAIDVRRSGGLVELQAVVAATKPVAGTWRMVVTKTGGGRSDIDQSGPVSAPAGGSAVVGTVSLGGTGSWSARLTIDTDGGTSSCARSGSL